MTEKASDASLVLIADSEHAEPWEVEAMARELLALRDSRRYALPSIHMTKCWAWCEELEPDAPPQMVEQRMVGGLLRCMRWAIAGWMEVKGRICPIERPEDVRMREVPS